MVKQGKGAVGLLFPVYAHGHPKEDASKSGGCPASRGKIFPYSIGRPTKKVLEKYEKRVIILLNNLIIKLLRNQNIKVSKHCAERSIWKWET